MINVLRVTKKFLFKEFHKIARQHGVKLNIKPISNAAGLYNEEINKITIDSNSNKKQLPFIFFHELGHLYCVNNNIWETYHNFDNTWSAYKSTALKAERWIDLWAEKEVKKYFNNIDCYKPYHTKEGVKELREMVDTVFYNYWVLKNKK